MSRFVACCVMDDEQCAYRLRVRLQYISSFSIPALTHFRLHEMQTPCIDHIYMHVGFTRARPSNYDEAVASQNSTSFANFVWLTHFLYRLMHLLSSASSALDNWHRYHIHLGTGVEYIQYPVEHTLSSTVSKPPPRVRLG